MVLRIKEKELERIVAHSKSEFPLEACGILIGIKEGTTLTVKEVHKTKNILESSDNYQIDPKKQLEIFLDADKRKLEVIGFYHSHPFYDADYSSTDLSSANYPDHLYLIYSKRDNEFKCFLWNGKGFDSENIEKID
jgi:proteasome lid subunit RPN8/RPN11